MDAKEDRLGEWVVIEVFALDKADPGGQLTSTPEGMIRLPREFKIKVPELPVHDWFGSTIGSHDRGSSGKTPRNRFFAEETDDRVLWWMQYDDSNSED